MVFLHLICISSAFPIIFISPITIHVQYCLFCNVVNPVLVCLVLVLYTTACDQSNISLISSLALFSWDLLVTSLLRLCVSSTDHWVKDSLQPLSTSWYFWQHVHVYLHYKCIYALWTALFLSLSISIYFICHFYSLVAQSFSLSFSLYLSVLTLYRVML